MTVRGPFCDYPFRKIHIHCTGDIFMCCFQRNYPIGNLLGSSIEDIWYGEAAQAVRKEISAGHLPPICHGGGCPYDQGPRWRAEGRPELQLPTHISVDLPNYHCNIGGNTPTPRRPACLMCERNLPNYEFHHENRLPEVLPKICHLLPHLQSIHVQGVAEAFWKDAIFDVLDLLKFDPFKDKIGVSTVTNGTLLNEKTLLRFLGRCPRAHLSFSVDAGSPETYRKIRRLDAYPLVVENMMRVSRLRKAFPCVVLRIQNNINTLNVHEIEEMVRVAARAEANEIEFQPTGGHPQDILVNAENYRLFSNAQTLAYATGKRLGVRVRFLRPLDMGFSAAEQQARRIASGDKPGGLRPSISSAGEARGNVDEAAVDTLIGIVARYMADRGITEGDDVPIREAALAIARTIGGGRA